jgi:serine/threonine protein phosphatase PrpC
MQLVSAAISKPGGRVKNEDAWGSEQMNRHAGCWVLADGLGGHGGGDAASRLAVEHSLAAFRRNATVAPQTLEYYLASAQAAILAGQKGTATLSQMRTTLVILLSDFHTALWAHIGDSRLYYFRAGRLILQTLDHSVPQALVDAGALQPDMIRHHPDRNQLLRSLGSADPLHPTLLAQPVALAAGDAFLLCSDGFWEYVLEAEMEKELAEASNPKAWLTRMEAHLLWRAPAWHDNYTAVAVSVNE